MNASAVTFEPEMVSTKQVSIPEVFRDARDHEPHLVWNYTTKGWLRRAETSVLFGPSNCGKSALLGYLGYCIVSGKRFFGARVKQGLVVHVAAEAAESVLDRTLGYDIKNPLNARYIVRTEAVDLSDHEVVTAFIEDLKEISNQFGEQIVLIVFDTLARSIGSTDENSSGEMTKIAGAADRVASTMKSHGMLVHHTGKDADRGGRGSSALRGAVDTEICLTPSSNGSVCVAQVKQRSMQQSKPVWFKTEAVILGKDEDGEDRTTVRAVEAEEPAKTGKSPATGSVTEARKTAVATALHIRRKSVSIATKPFRTSELIDWLPAELFKDMAAESRNKSVIRILEALAMETNPTVRGANGTWQLIANARSCEA